MDEEHDILYLLIVSAAERETYQIKVSTLKTLHSSIPLIPYILQYNVKLGLALHVKQ